MLDKNHRILLRVGFLLGCLLPTGLQVWSPICELCQRVSHWRSSTGPDTTVGERGPQPDKLAFEKGSGKSIGALGQRPVVAEDSNTKTRSTKMPGAGTSTARTSTAETSTVEDNDILIAGSRIPVQMSGRWATVAHEDLPLGHPLRLIPCDAMRIDVQVSTFAAEVKKVTVTTDQMRDAWIRLKAQTSFRQLSPATYWTLKIKHLTLKHPSESPGGSSRSRATEWRDVEIQWAASHPNRLEISGRRRRDADDLAPVTEYPFRLNLDASEPVLELSGADIPLDLIDRRLASMLGSTAQLSGKYRASSSSDSRVEFTGTLSNVDCLNLSAWLGSTPSGSLSGKCQIMIDHWVQDAKGIRMADLQIQSTTDGEVSRHLADLLTPHAEWVPTATRIRYRSFLLKVKLENGVWSVRSVYPGRQLVWGDAGQDILRQRLR